MVSILKFTVAVIAVILLFAQCRKPENDEAVDTKDTLGIQWSVVDRAHITYHFQDISAGVAAASRFADQHEEAYAFIDQVFKAKLPQKLSFFIWADTTVAQQVLKRNPGFALPKQCICHIGTNQARGHEMTHVLSYWAGGVAPTKTTKFFDEGLSIAFDLNPENKISKAITAIAGENIKSVAQAWAGQYDTSDKIMLPIAGAFVDYLYKQNMPDQFNAVVKNQTIENAQAVYGKDKLDKLVADFNKLVGL